MKRLLFTLIMGFSFFGLLGQTNKFKTVDVDEFSKFIADTAVTLLDVRTQAEHAEGFIPGTHFNIDVLEDDYTETLSGLYRKISLWLSTAVVVTEARMQPAYLRKRDMRWWSSEQDSAVG